MGANVNQTTSARPYLAVVSFAFGLLFAVLAWLRCDPEYASVTRREVREPASYHAGEASTP